MVPPSSAAGWLPAAPLEKAMGVGGRAAVRRSGLWRERYPQALT
ncbi:hypothetical protein ACFPRL_26405 [Pseudoclavibacter helvolus]